MIGALARPGAILGRRTARYSMVGASGMVLDLMMLALLYGSLGVPLLIANAISFLTAVASNYTLNRRWTFADRGRRSVGAGGTIFLSAALVGLAISEAGLWVLTERGAYYLVAKLVMTAAVFGWNYGFNNAVTFRGQATARE